MPIKYYNFYFCKIIKYLPNVPIILTGYDFHFSEVLPPFINIIVVTLCGGHLQKELVTPFETVLTSHSTGMTEYLCSSLKYPIIH